MLDQLGMAGLGGLLGYPQTYNGMYGQMNSQLTQQQFQYNQALTQAIMNRPVWMFDGVQCNVRTMADKIWPTDCPDKTHFLLKYE